MENICEIVQMLQIFFFITVYGISQSPLPHPLLFSLTLHVQDPQPPERRGQAVNLVSEQRAPSAYFLGARKGLKIS